MSMEASPCSPSQMSRKSRKKVKVVDHLYRQKDIPHLLIPSLLMKPPGIVEEETFLGISRSTGSSKPLKLFQFQSRAVFKGQNLQTNEEMVEFLPGLCLIFALEPHLEDTLERSTFLFWICTWRDKKQELSTEKPLKSLEGKGHLKLCSVSLCSCSPLLFLLQNPRNPFWALRQPRGH